jgi:hypothetical protein
MALATEQQRAFNALMRQSFPAFLEKAFQTVANGGRLAAIGTSTPFAGSSSASGRASPIVWS